MNYLTKLNQLEENIRIDDEKFHQHKPVFRSEITNPYEFYFGTELGKEQIEENFARFCYEYEMDYYRYSTKMVLKCNLSPVQLEYVHAVKNFLCENSNLKEFSTLVGKSAEMIFRNAVNNLFHMFNLKKRIHLNTKNFVYGGDGGSDFIVGKFKFDVKARNDSPSHGMILERVFLDRTPNEVIFIHATNATSIKLNNDYKENQTLPLALSGWMSAEEFKITATKIANGRDSLAVDNLRPISDLLLMVLRDQLKVEETLLYG